MPTILVIKGDIPNETSSAAQLVRGLKSVGSDTYDLASYREILWTINNDKVEAVIVPTGKKLHEYDLVYIRDFTGFVHERSACADVLQTTKARFINEDIGVHQHISKLTQYICLVRAGVRIPSTIYALNLEGLRAGVASLDAANGLVAKSIVGANGNANYYFATADELLDEAEKLIEQRCVVQEAIPNSFDYRVLVADDEVLLAYKRIRTNPESHLNNVHQGARREADENLSPIIRAMALKAAQVMGRNVAGVDVLIDERNQEPYLLEVNFNFGLSELNDEINQKLYIQMADYLHRKALD